MAKKKKTPFKYYECATDNPSIEIGYTRIQNLQLICMNELSANAFRLYIMMKSYAKSEIQFEFPHRIHKTFMSKQTFVKARDELVDLGYIEPFVSCKVVRKANLYKFSGEWKSRNKDRISNIIEMKKGL